MAEFKLSQGLSAEIEALNNAGVNVNASVTELPTDGVSTLKTSMRYAELGGRIKELMKLYGDLLIKDASDLETMMASVQNADNAGAGSFR